MRKLNSIFFNLKTLNSLSVVFLFLLSNACFAQNYLLDNTTNGTTINTCSGNFFDSGNAGANYNNAANLTVTFCAPNPDDKIQLAFSAFQIEINYDFMYIYDGANTNAKLLGTYSGLLNSPGTISSITGNCLTVKFTSDGTTTRPGWQAAISCKTPTFDPTDVIMSNANNGQTQTVCSGSFYDSGGSSVDYGNNQDRIITFCASNPTERLQLDFTAFSLESGYDFMSIYDGSNTSGSLIGTYTGAGSPGQIASINTNCLTIRFKSDGANTAGGWAATIACVPPDAGNSCGLVIKTLSVSGCYTINGVSKSTITAEVAWDNAPPNKAINVILGTTTKTITPGNISVNYGPAAVGTGAQTIVSPQVVAFEVDADGTSGTLRAEFVSSNCKTNKSYSLPSACNVVCGGSNLGGTVFDDYDRDGIKDANETSTVGNITVTAIDKTGALFVTKTNAAGKYSLDIPMANYPIRLEFSNIPPAYGQGTRNGTDGRTTTQFITAADCNADLGILAATDFCSGSPKVFLPVYGNGNPLVAGNPATAKALIGFNYGTTGTTNTTNTTTYATGAQVGSLWGVAHNRKTNRVFTTATLKRHVGLGPKGLAGLYVVNPTIATGPIDSWDLSTIGIDVGTVPTNAIRGLTNNILTPSYDTSAWYGAGRRGIGDIDISEDFNTLYFVNLYDKKLYKLDITAYNATGTAPTASDWKSFPIPDPGCEGGTLRPWGTKFYNGKVYVGAVCDGFTSQKKADLRAFVYEFDPETENWYNRLDFPLTYPKGFALGTTTAQMGITGWFPWSDNFAAKVTTTASRNWVVHPEPILSDIEFDVDGSMTLGFMDRTAVQSGYRNYGLTGTLLYSASAGGDLIKAYYNNGSFILENNAKAGSAIGDGVDNKQGPGFGEFYNDNWLFNPSSLFHAENALGGLAVRPGSGEVLATNIDPTDGVAWSAGLRYYNNATGEAAKSFVAYTADGSTTNGTQGKAAGIGDIEVLCSLPTDLEIGNRVWIDSNGDGVQDPTEAPLAGVKVRLYQGTTLIAETTTNVNGEYYFRDNAVVGVTWSGTGTDTKLLPNTDYTIVFGKSATDQFASNQLTLAGKQYNLTTANSTTGTGNDINDSDASLMSLSGVNYPSINHRTAEEGVINHTLDVGFFLCQTITDISPTQTVCANSSGADITIKTNFNTANSIRFMAFTKPQVGDSMYINQGISLSTVTPAGSVAPYTATYLWNNADFTSGGTYYVYALLNPDFGASCRPSQEVIINVKPIPTIGGAIITPVTCTNGLSNNDATIQITGISGMAKYTHSTTGVTGLLLSNANSSTANSILIDNIANPSSAITYIFRLYSSDDACYKDTSVVLEPRVCPNCTAPIAPAPTSVAGTCSGTTPNNDASVVFVGISNADKADKWEGTSYQGVDYQGATETINVGDITFTNLKHNTKYVFRFWNASNSCFSDVMVTTPDKNNCVVVICTQPVIGANAPTAGSCTGLTVNDDATLVINGISNADKADISEGTVYSGNIYTAATYNVLNGTLNFAALKHGTAYTVRVFNATNDCFMDVTITTPTKNCSNPCPQKVCGPVKITRTN